MPGISHIPFPSFTLLLTSERVVVPGPSSIRFAPPVYRSISDLMTTIHPQEKDIQEQTLFTTFSNDTASAIIHGDSETEPTVSEQELEVENGAANEKRSLISSLQGRATLYISKIVKWMFQPTWA